jgi:microcystin degradation protein MlrC
MRVAIAGLFEEVNTFAVETMGLATITGDFSTGFQRFAGQEMVDAVKGTKGHVAGFIAALEELPDVEILPASVWLFGAGPTIDRDAYQKMKQDILDSLTAAMPFDAIALQLHGAGIAEGINDVEGDLTSAIRKLVGPKVKIVASLDHHGNVTDFFLRQMDFVTTVYHYPHIDEYESAYRAAKLIPAMVNGSIKPHGHFEHLPFIMQMCSTMEGNLFEPIRKKAEGFAKRDGIYEFSYFYGFPTCDISFNTATVNCWAKSPELAAGTAKEFASWIWENRQQFVAPLVSASNAVQQALAALAQQGRIGSSQIARPQPVEESLKRLASANEELNRASGFVPDSGSAGPVIIAEKSDNPGCGAPGDSTHVLWELIRNNVQPAAVCAIRDPETVQQAMKAGVGSIIDVKLGGKLSRFSGEPVQGKAYVKTISDGRYTIVSPMLNGGKVNVGPAVGLIIEGVDVAVISGIMQSFDHGQMKMVGFDSAYYRIILIKSANHFRAWWSAKASQIIDCDPPGIASNDLTSFKFTNKNRKLYPLDADAVYPESKAMH